MEATMTSPIAGIEFSIEFSHSDKFLASYNHKSVPAGNNIGEYLECFPYCLESCKNISCGAPLKATLNILIPSSIAATVNEDDIIQKICCVGELRTDDGNPTIQKSLTGQELSEFVTNTDMKKAQMYWGRIVRRLEPVTSPNGTFLTVQIEFNSDGALWRYSSNSEDHIVKPSSRMCFSITLLILHISSKQSVLSINNPVLLKNMFKNEIFFPIAYFDSPSFSTQPKNDDTVVENELRMGDDNFIDSKYSEEDSSVLDRILSSAPYLQSRDDFLLATWLRSVHHSISSVVSESFGVSGLGFRYEIPAVYRDTTKTFLPLFLQLLPPRHFDTPVPENENLLSDKKDLSTEDKAKIFYDMRRDATVACLTNKMRVPIVTETAAMYVMTEIAKEKIAKKQHVNLGTSSFSVSNSNQDLSSESVSFDNSSAEKPSFENEQESSEKDLQSLPSQLVHLQNELSAIPESGKEDKPYTAIDFLSMVAQYYVSQNGVSSTVDTVKADITPNNIQTIEHVKEEVESPPPKRIKLT